MGKDKTVQIPRKLLKQITDELYGQMDLEYGSYREHCDDNGLDPDNVFGNQSLTYARFAVLAGQLSKILNANKKKQAKG